MEARIGDQLERIEARGEEAAAMEARIVAAVSGRPRPGPEPAADA